MPVCLCIAYGWARCVRFPVLMMQEFRIFGFRCKYQQIVMRTEKWSNFTSVMVISYGLVRMICQFCIHKQSKPFMDRDPSVSKQIDTICPSPWCQCKRLVRWMFTTRDVASGAMRSAAKLFVIIKTESRYIKINWSLELFFFDGQSVNITKYFNLYSFDIMEDLAFGASFQMLESNEEHWAIKLLNDGIEPLGYFFPTWFFRIMVAIPSLMNDWWKFIHYCSHMLDERIKVRCICKKRFELMLNET